jgi:colanic acid/amylovoran biosynthesis glycosyltransferase
MAHALPVLATRHGGIPEAIVDGATGYLVDERDTAAMSDQLAFLAGDADKRRELGVAGWAHAREHFSWDRERARLRALLGIDHLRDDIAPPAVHRRDVTPGIRDGPW